MIVFDIETGPLPDEQLLATASPYEPPPHPGAFDKSTVKLGQLKDQEKINAKIEKARQAHEAVVAEHNQKVEQGKQDWFDNIKDRAALSATTGLVVAIGFHSTDNGKTQLHIDKPESDLLNIFWHWFIHCRDANRLLVGHNILGFDLPFLIRRSWFNGVDVPEGVFERGRYLNARVFKDTMQMWACGTRDMIKLDTLAKVLGFEGKLEGVDGSMFADLIKSDLAKAQEYLAADVVQTAKVAERMGLL